MYFRSRQPLRRGGASSETACLPAPHRLRKAPDTTTLNLKLPASSSPKELPVQPHPQAPPPPTMESPSSRARLRRTFRYPDDSSVPENLDEQEQESLISDLSAQNALQNHHFARLLLTLPLFTTFFYLPLLFRTRHDVIIALLSLTSLLSTTYLLHTLPPETTGIELLDAWSRGGHARHQGDPAEAAACARVMMMERQARRLQRGLGYDRAPLEMYLPYLNGALAMVLSLMGLVTERGVVGGSTCIVRGNLPAVVYGVVLLAKVVMGSVDPERELSPLKYEYRGA
ncbi:hypothetical protein E4U21_002515 [Claviceps maximensis]|nr:hypothetical protein E4U21_002515 [Claviceps maximensis]